MIALYDSLGSLVQGVEEMGNLSPEYWQKQCHKVPSAPSVDRVSWLLNRLAGKTIVHIGCHGPLHKALLKVCAKAYGIDHVPASYPNYCEMDIEGEELPRYGDVEVVLLAEVLEHMTSPGVLLWQVRERYPGCEVIITCPNAFSLAGWQWIQRGIENVNTDHTFWPSWRTMTTLLTKCGYVIDQWCWHGGKPPTSEGLIFTCHGKDG